MSEPRPHPFSLVFSDIAAERFPAVAEELDPLPPLDRFLMSGAVVELLRDLRPDSGLGDAADEFVAFVHAAYCFWGSGARTRILDAPTTRALLVTPRETARRRLDHGAVGYIQVAPRLVWSRLAEADVHEPLDGWFALPGTRGLRMVACLGVHPSRPGLSVLTVEGDSPDHLGRPDGTPAFAPQMEGGDTAGLASVATSSELLAMGWNAVMREPS